MGLGALLRVGSVKARFRYEVLESAEVCMRLCLLCAQLMYDLGVSWYCKMMIIIIDKTWAHASYLDN